MCGSTTAMAYCTTTSPTAATTASATSVTAPAASTPAASTAAAASAVPGSAGDRKDAPEGAHADPPRELLRRARQARPVEPGGPRDPAEAACGHAVAAQGAGQ